MKIKFPDKSELRKAAIPALISFILIGFTIYAARSRNNELEKYGVITVGYTTGEHLIYKSVKTRYFFKTSQGIYTGLSSTTGSLKNAQYYKVRYSRRDPTISEIFQDSLVPDTIGIHYIYRKEIYPANIVNRDQVPDWQW